MDDKKKKHIKTFSEFLADRKKSEPEKIENKVDWYERKTLWLKSIDNLYNTVDIIIVNNFRNAGFEVSSKKEKVRIFEEYIGAYDVENYYIKALQEIEYLRNLPLDVRNRMDLSDLDAKEEKFISILNGTFSQ